MSKVKFSLEVFPPKATDGIEKIYDCLEGMSKLSPDFISVTYSAGEAKKGLTKEVCEYLQNRYNIPSVAHLTCAGETKESIQNQLTSLKEGGIRTILALRGDLTEEKKLTEFVHATELMKAVNNFGGFSLMGACYPEGHAESKSFSDDIEVLKWKDELGVKEFLSQLFLDNDYFLHMRNEAVKRGVKATLSAGIMPVTNAKRVVRMVQLSNATIPGNVQKMLAKYENDESGLMRAGLDYAVEQIRSLVKEGVTSVHLYAMNNIQTASYIHQGILDLL